MKFICVIYLLTVFTFAIAKNCQRKSSNKLICYYGTFAKNLDLCRCSHVILPLDFNAGFDGFKDKGPKILVIVNEFNENLIKLLKTKKVDGIDLNLHNLTSPNDLQDIISTIRTKLNPDLHIALSVPPKTDFLAKYYDFKQLSTTVDLFILQTAFLMGTNTNTTFHPSRLSGLWDMQNIDSVVDLVGGLGVPLSKLVVTSPVQAYKFQLQNPEYTAPGDPALSIESLNRDDLCQLMGSGNWTLERDQDQAGPYIFRKNQWIAFDDDTSIGIKAKYARIRGLAGLALKDLSQDASKCSPLLEAAYKGLSQQSRAPRGAVLHSLEREIMTNSPNLVDSIQVSPYRISRIIDVEGHIHVVRQDTRTEFRCSRQGYFVHPRSCNRFYRCVKFNQLIDEFNVFEFDCPAGLAFDERFEVCVWPGSLSDGSPCSGSSEIAPVPQERFVCPNEAGYYADPENCRWFYACLDDGKSVVPYEFRCPFGLVYDELRLLCEWSWLVPRCASGYTSSQVVWGGNILEQYDGLGVLHRVQLGGIAGGFEGAKIYSNVGTGGGTLQNGLSYQAVSSLEKAGLLRSGLGYNQNQNSGIEYKLAGSTGVSNVVYSTSNQGAILTSGSHNSVGTLQNGNYQQTGAGTNSGYSTYKENNENQENTGIYHGVGVDYNTNYALKSGNSGYDTNFGLKETVSNTFQGIGANLNFGNEEIFKSGTYQGSNINFGNKAINAVTYQRTGAEINSGPLYNGEANSEQTFIQYHNPEQQVISQNTGTAGNINIIGGGYSAVSDGLEISNEEDRNFLTSVTPVSVTAVPTVTAVPVPAIKTVEAFKSYNGGVIANVPQLQVHVSTARPFSTDLNYGKINSITNVFGLKTVPTVQAQPNSNNYQEKFEGYDYPKPSVAFVERPVHVLKQPISVVPIVSSTPQAELAYSQAPVTLKEAQKPYVRGHSYQYNQQYHSGTIQKQEEGYDYPKPSVAFVERPVQVTKQSVGIVPVVSSTPEPELTYSQTPIAFEAKKMYVSGNSYQYNQQYHGGTIQKSDEGYKYPKPAVAFKDSPVQAISSYSYQDVLRKSVASKPILQQTPVQVYSSTQKPYSYTGTSTPSLAIFEGYNYHEPSVAFVEQPAQDFKQPISVVPVVSSTPKSELVYSHTPSVAFYKEPVNEVAFKAKKAYVTGHSYQYNQQYHTGTVQKQFEGYNYPKPSVAFNERPVHVSKQAFSVVPIVSSTPRPQLVYSQAPVIIKETQKPYVRGHSYQYNQQYHSGTIQKQEEGYDYPKPLVAFVERPVQVTKQSVGIVPVVSSTPEPELIYSQTPIAFEAKKTYVSGNSYQYNQQYHGDTIQKQTEGYQYIKPLVSLVKSPLISTNYSPAIQQTPASSYVITGTNIGYQYPKPAVAFTEEIAQQPIVLTTFRPATLKTPISDFFITGTDEYDYSKPVVPFIKGVVKSVPVISTTTRPVIIPSFSITGTNRNEGYNYPKPSVSFVEGEIPIVSTTPKSVIIQKQPVSTYSFTGSTRNEGYNYPKPTVAFVEERGPAISASPKPISTYFIDGTSQSRGYNYPKPSVPFTSGIIRQPKIVSSFNLTNLRSFNEYYPANPTNTFYENQQPVVEVPFTTKKEYVTGQNPVFIENYSISTSPRMTFKDVIKPVGRQFNFYDSRFTPTPTTVISTTPTPIGVSTFKKTVSYIAPTVPTSYVPLRQRVVVPTKEYLPAQIPQVETYLPPQLIPQRKKVVIPTREYHPIEVPKVKNYLPPRESYVAQTIVKTNDFHPLLPAKLGAQCTCISNPLRLRKKPKTIEFIDDYQPIRKVVRIRPVSTTEPSDEEVVQAVRTGLKLVKQAAKEGAAEGTQEILTGNLDRFGHGGWRSRDEKLQGTIDCQRAGLFRHPSQCNKFYACRWDCTKNRFTLHVFNCPVHLTFDNTLGACNWPSQGPACADNTLLPSD